MTMRYIKPHFIIIIIIIIITSVNSVLVANCISYVVCIEIVAGIDVLK